MGEDSSQVRGHVARVATRIHHEPAVELLSCSTNRRESDGNLQRAKAVAAEQSGAKAAQVGWCAVKARAALVRDHDGRRDAVRVQRVVHRICADEPGNSRRDGRGRKGRGKLRRRGDGEPTGEPPRWTRRG